jgi:hypothetical protein
LPSIFLCHSTMSFELGSTVWNAKSSSTPERVSCRTAQAGYSPSGCSPRRLRVASSKCWKSHVNTSLRYSAPALCGLVRGRPCRPPLRHEPSTSVSLLSPPVDIVSAPPWSDPVVPTRERHTLHHRTLCCVRESSPSGPETPPTLDRQQLRLPDDQRYVVRTKSPYSKPANFIQYLAYRVG